VKDIPLPQPYPTGLVVQRKPVVKVSLIIVNGRRNTATQVIDLSGDIAATVRPSAALRRDLDRGSTKIGGKLPRLETF
jgi:hypothetical protein